MNIRNSIARLPIMKKGGTHGQSKKAKKRDERASLKKEMKRGSYGSFFDFIALFLHILLTEDHLFDIIDI